MNIGTLTIEIAAGVARLQKDMDESKRVVSGAMKDIETYVGYAKTAMVALTGVASAGAFIHLIQGAIDAKAQLYDLSVITGMSVESISTLNEVARYSNTAIGDVTSASTKLSKALYTQNEDSKGAAQGLKALGIDFDRFKQLQPDEQMRLVAVQMDKFADGAGKAAAAQLLFGKQGAQLLPFLKEFAERQELVGKETTASAKAAKDYQDNLVSLQRAGEEWKRQLVNDILPALVNITNELVDGRKAYGGWISAIIDLGLNVDPFKTMGENITATRDQLGKLRGDLKEMEDRKQRIASGQGSISDSFNDIGGDKARERIKEQIALLEKRDAYLKSQQQRAALALGDGITDRFNRPKPNLDVPPVPDKNKGLSDYEELIRQINEKVAMDEAELQSTKKLTDVEQLQIRIINDIDSGKRKLTVTEMVNVDAALQAARAKEKEVEARKAEVKWLQETGVENDRAVEQQQRRLNGYQDEVASLKMALEEYGLTRHELEALNQARLQEAAAALEQKAVWADSRYLQDQAQLYRDQAQALRDAAGLRKRLSDLERADRQDPARGADRAIKDYLEHIKNAGDETYRAVGDALQGLEDMGTRVLMGGKANARAWAEAWISEVLRMRVIRPLLQDIFGSAGGLGGVIGGLFGGGGLTVDPGGFGIGGGNQPLADLGLGARDVVLPSTGPLAAGGGGRGTLSITFAPVTQIDARSDQAQVAQIADTTSRRHSAELVELLHSRGVV